MALVGVLGKPHARGGQWASHCLEMGYGIITPAALPPPDTRSPVPHVHVQHDNVCPTNVIVH